MRKIIREMMRADAKREKNKPSRWVKAAFDQYQMKKYGVDKRKRNQAVGTHKQKLWNSRVTLFADR